jgi:hypothetical protein
VSTIAIKLAAGFVFGFETFGAFLHALSAAAGSHLVRSDLGWNKLQSVYGLLRYAGATAAVAWSAQAATSLAAAAGVVLCWRNRAIPFPMKASFLAAATVLVTPYILYYDVPVLGIAIAFLFRHRAFDRTELVALAIEVPCLAAPFFVTVPAALLASLLIGALVIRRVFSDEFHLGTLCRSWLNLNALHSGEPKTIAVVEARPDGAA